MSKPEAPKAADTSLVGALSAGSPPLFCMRVKASARTEKPTESMEVIGPEVNNEPTVPLAVDDIDEPVLDFVGVVRVVCTVDVDDHLAESTTEPR